MRRSFFASTVRYSVIDPNAFIFTVKTDNAGTSASNQFTIPTRVGPTYNYNVSTSDGQIITGNTGNLTITFPFVGEYDITITGIFPQIYFNNSGDKNKIISLTQFGNVEQSNDQDSSYNGCSNLVGELPDDFLWINNVTTAFAMFQTSGISGSLPNGVTLENLAIGARMFNETSLSGVIPSSVNMINLSGGFWMFRGNSFTTQSYSDLLIKLETNNLNNNVTFHGGASKYNSAGETARNALIARGWTITDGGLEV